MAEFKSFYKTVDGNEGQKCHYSTRLDTYGCGCAHDCNYCYAKSLLEFRDLWNAKEPRVADIQKIEKKIKTLKKGSLVRLGGMTDCFQPCEVTHKVTYQTIRLLNKYGIHYLIVTKSNLVASDEYMQILDKNLAHIQVTVTCTDDKFAASYEKATPPSLRIKAIEKLEAAGFDAQIRLSPFIPEFIDLDIIRDVKCKRAIVEFLRVNPFIKKLFHLQYDAYTHKEGGYQHLPLKTKQELIAKIATHKEVSVCEDCDQAYEYWKNNLNPFPDDCCNLRFNTQIRAIGNMDLLREEKIAFLSSAINDERINQAAAEWAKSLAPNSCVISGFQSKAEQVVLDVLLKSNQKIIMVLAKKMFDKCPTKYQKLVTIGRMLIIAPYNNYENVTTKENALKRNEYLLNRAQSIALGFVKPNGMLDSLLKNQEKPTQILVRRI